MARRRKQALTPKPKPSAGEERVRDSQLPTPDRDAVIAALKAHCGIVLRAAKALGVSRAWLSGQVNRDPELDALRHEAQRYAFDVSMESALGLVEDGDKDATLQVLRLTGWRYGFKHGTGVEVSGPDGAPVQVEHIGANAINEIARSIYGTPED